MMDLDSNVKAAHRQSIYKKFQLLFLLVALLAVGYWLGGQDVALRFLELFIGFQLISAMQEIHYLTLRIDQLEAKLDNAVKQLASQVESIK